MNGSRALDPTAVSSFGRRENRSVKLGHAARRVVLLLVRACLAPERPGTPRRRPGCTAEASQLDDALTLLTCMIAPFGEKACRWRTLKPADSMIRKRLQA